MGRRKAAEMGVTLEQAIAEAKHGSHMIYRESKSWHHRGVYTEINDPEDVCATDWHVVKSPEPKLPSAPSQAGETASSFICPVCEYNMAPYKPVDYNICPQCGTEFGVSDADASHEELRAAWIADGRKFWFKRAVPTEVAALIAPAAVSETERAADGDGWIGEREKIMMTQLTVDNAMDYLYHTAMGAFEERVREVCTRLLADPMFAQAPGSTGHHHAFRGGLALHTAEVVRNCGVLGVYLDWSVLLTAAVWHDAGKRWEYELPAEDGGKIATTEYRDMVGHVCGSVIELHRALANSGADEGWLLRVTHCMLAHHGRLEWRSPVEPRLPEAWVLHAADMMSARGVGVIGALKPVW